MEEEIRLLEQETSQTYNTMMLSTTPSKFLEILVDTYGAENLFVERVEMHGEGGASQCLDGRLRFKEQEDMEQTSKERGTEFETYQRMGRLVKGLFLYYGFEPSSYHITLEIKWDQTATYDVVDDEVRDKSGNMRLTLAKANSKTPAQVFAHATGIYSKAKDEEKDPANFYLARGAWLAEISALNSRDDSL
jgi:hypothetical protein